MSGITDAQIDDVMARYADLIDSEVKRAAMAEQADGYLAADACRDIFRRAWLALGKAVREVEGSG